MVMESFNKCYYLANQGSFQLDYIRYNKPFGDFEVLAIIQETLHYS